MKLYIAGPMSGYPDHNYPLFNATAAELRAHGVTVVNPVEITSNTTTDWLTCMRKDIAELVTCSAILMLPSWKVSKGARLEHYIAKKLGFTVYFYRQHEGNSASLADIAQKFNSACAEQGDKLQLLEALRDKQAYLQSL